MTLMARASHSHLFRGAELRLADLDDLRPSALRVLFADGVVVGAELTAGTEDLWLLKVHGYVTAAGAVVEPMVWVVAGIKREEEDLVVKLAGKFEA